MTEQSTKARDVRDGVRVHTSGELVRRAAAHDASAWQLLVDRHVGLVWSVARQYRLSNEDAADVVQTSWLRLAEHIDRLTDPEHVASWLVTTTRRECLRVLSSSRRTVPTAVEADVFNRLSTEDVAADGLIRDENVEEVRTALLHLSPTWRALMEMLMEQPTPSYEDVSAVLGLPMGSIGPTRGRALRKLRELLDA